LIVFDASTIVGAVLKADSIPEKALLSAEATDVFALSEAVDREIASVLERPKFAQAISPARRGRFLDVFRSMAIWFEPSVRIQDCRDVKDNKYLELALASGAEIIVSSDLDLLILDPWRDTRILRPADYLAFTRSAILPPP
jgi:putative PIN family toxin of toxin-antitoxin system